MLEYQVGAFRVLLEAQGWPTVVVGGKGPERRAMAALGYLPVRNPGAADGRWQVPRVVGPRDRRTIYGRDDTPHHVLLDEARAVTRGAAVDAGSL